MVRGFPYVLELFKFAQIHSGSPFFVFSGALRNYPRAFGEKFAELYPKLIADKKGLPVLPRQIPSAEETFDSLSYDDKWPEASMASVCHWLRGSKALRVPASFRPLLPNSL